MTFSQNIVFNVRCLSLIIVCHCLLIVICRCLSLLLFVACRCLPFLVVGHSSPFVVCRLLLFVVVCPMLLFVVFIFVVGRCLSLVGSHLLWLVPLPRLALQGLTPISSPPSERRGASPQRSRPGPASGNSLGPHLVSSCGRGLLAYVGVVEIGKRLFSTNICDHQHALRVRSRYDDK